jgi:hypothetical protein
VVHAPSLNMYVFGHTCHVQVQPLSTATGLFLRKFTHKRSRILPLMHSLATILQALLSIQSLQM